MNWYFKVWRQYADFSTRARRTEYWMFTLFDVIIIIGLVILGAAVSDDFENPIGAVFIVVYILASLVPRYAVSVRRLHDIGKSGWMVLLGFIPYVGGLIMLILHCMSGEPGPNKWGPNPKEADVIEPEDDDTLDRYLTKER